MPAAISQFVFNPSRLTAATKAAFAESVKIAGATAKGLQHEKKRSGVRSGVNGDVGYLRATGLGTVFEVGRQGGYPIYPGGVRGYRKSSSVGAIGDLSGSGRTYSMRSKRGGTARALQFSHGDGGFAAYAFGGSMNAYPALVPAAELWANGIYQRTASLQLAAAGFGARV